MEPASSASSSIYFLTCVVQPLSSSMGDGKRTVALLVDGEEPLELDCGGSEPGGAVILGRGGQR